MRNEGNQDRTPDFFDESEAYKNAREKPDVDDKPRAAKEADDSEIKKFRSFFDNDRETFERSEDIKWYLAAQEKASEVIRSIDLELHVAADVVDILYRNAKTPIRKTVLRFSHPSKRELHWTMEIARTDEYLQTGLEAAIRRVVERKAGGVSEKAEASHDIRFRADELREAKIREKSKDERAVVEEVSRMTDALREQFGLKGVNVPPEKISVIARDSWKFEGVSAMYVKGKNEIFVKDSGNLLAFQKEVLHEMLHLKSGNILPKSLNEALVESLTKKLLLENTSSLPAVKDAQEDFETYRGIFSDYRTNDGSPLIHEETFDGYMNREGNAVALAYGYKFERRLLGLLTKKMAEKNPKAFPTRDDAAIFLVKASLAGDFSAIRELNATFGKDFVERIKKAGSDLRKAAAIIEGL